MRKLNELERAALYFLERDGPACPGDLALGEAGQVVKNVLDGLVRKKRAYVEMTDDGPRYHLTAQGRADAHA